MLLLGWFRRGLGPNDYIVTKHVCYVVESWIELELISKSWIECCFNFTLNRIESTCKLQHAFAWARARSGQRTWSAKTIFTCSFAGDINTTMTRSQLISGLYRYGKGFICSSRLSDNLDKVIANYFASKRGYAKTSTNATIFEIFNGVGGSEAMLFANEMLSVYENYFIHKKWLYRIEEVNHGDGASMRLAKVIIETPNASERLIQEAGVHRVQRVPKTERQGRMHTSTISIAVTPQSVLDIVIDERDLEFQSKRASGPGGQFVNKKESAVRLLHRPSGIAVESQESRHQIDNKKIAMKKLLDKLQTTELEKLSTHAMRMKRKQLGNSDRNEKIRTYNFPQDRLTDHRIGKSYHNLRGLFAGDISILDRVIDDYNA